MWNCLPVDPDAPDSADGICNLFGQGLPDHVMCHPFRRIPAVGKTGAHLPVNLVVAVVPGIPVEMVPDHIVLHGA